VQLGLVERPTGSSAPTRVGCAAASTSAPAWSVSRASCSSASRRPGSTRAAGSSSGTHAGSIPYVDYLVPGFRLHGSVLEGLAAFGLVLVFGFAFEWLFVTMGLLAGTAQAAQGMGMIVFPLAFISSAYVPLASMQGWLQVFARYQPLTPMVDSVRALTLGGRAEHELGHPASYDVARALVWTAAILLVSVPLAVGRYRRG
jgi:ABC-type multidrug transport system permease subunit